MESRTQSVIHLADMLFEALSLCYLLIDGISADDAVDEHLRSVRNLIA